ncbi:unnamed protein product [Calicophoron daubneyi]|uniref:Uncharacterized protein n=1 Tax=Calicophoron daubneyi TaxID=300641 RepID=A0AAV2TLY9_CALDB
MLRFSKILGRFPVRRTHRFLSSFPHESDPSEDINQIFLVGTVNIVDVRDAPGKLYAVLNMRTRESYRSEKGFSSKVSHHRVQVFDPKLVEKVRKLVKGDRVCVQGNLAAFPLTTANNTWIYCVIANSICPNPIEADECEATDEIDSTEDDAVSSAQSTEPSILKTDDILKSP